MRKPSREHVLVIDPDPVHAQSAAAALRHVLEHVVICPSVADGIVSMERQTFAVIVMVTRALTDWYRDVDVIRDVTLQRPLPARVVCLLRGGYRGPSDRVYAARKGFQVVYER